MLLNGIFYIVLLLSAIGPLAMAVWKAGKGPAPVETLLALGLSMMVLVALSVFSAALCKSARGLQIGVRTAGAVITAALGALGMLIQYHNMYEAWLGFALLYLFALGFMAMVLLAAFLGRSVYLKPRE